MTIRVLPPEVAAQIAAGEVVERPASAVKELIENALDAEASIITVELQEAGKRLIRVSDNGIGIPQNEVELAFHRHATSKLTSADELDHLTTLGFRGEALAAIAAVSRITLITRSMGESVGVRIHVEGGEITSVKPDGAPQGTSVAVENLFYNMPARLKFLKKETTERQQINALVSHYAMAYPSVRFSLFQGGAEILRTSGSGDLREVLSHVFGNEAAAQMLEVAPLIDSLQRDDLPSVEVRGFTSLPSMNRATRNAITLFVNGRWIQDSSLTHAVVQAYHTMLMVGRYPVAIILISLSPEEVDVNIHPTKAQVRFRRADAVFSAVQRTVRQALVEQAPPPQLLREATWGSPDWLARRERLTQITTARINQLGLSMDMEGDDRFSRHAAEDADSDQPESLSVRPKRELPMLRLVGQVGAMYIIAEGPRGLYLIDQHAAHERVLYEQFTAQQATRAVASQELLEPIMIELSPEQVALLEGSVSELEHVGFKIENFGRNSVRLRAVPALLAEGEPASALTAALGEIECGEMPVEATVEQRLIARICKQMAVKAGQILSDAEMEGLIRQLEECKSPQTCPHGRPTMLHLSAEDLAKQFGRLGAI